MNRLEWTEHSLTDLHNRYLKLLEFVNLIIDHNVNYYADIAEKLLKEVGES